MQTPETFLIPKPASAVPSNGAFELQPDLVIAAAGPAQPIGDLLAGWLRPATGYALPVVAAAREDQPAIILAMDGDLPWGEEAYRLEVNESSVTLRAAGAAGLRHAVQTLRQLLPPAVYSAQVVAGARWSLPGVVIEDAPRFGWRGSMLDVSRHFFGVETVKRYLDLLALHKFNRFHWHLTDDQGWRIEIKRYPRLTEVGAWRKGTMLTRPDDPDLQFDDQPHGGFYSQDQIREVVAYAAARGITIIPEIEMPGHAQAAIAAYPELGNLERRLEVATDWGVIENVFNVEESTFEFLQNVLLEVMDLFPGQHIHVGGDEVPKRQWNSSPKAQARMKALDLADADALQSYFIRRMDTFLNQHGRVLLGWDEILEGGLAENAIVVSWRGEEGGIAAAKMGHDVIMAPWNTTYFNLKQIDTPEEEPSYGLITLEQAHAYDPIPAALTPEEARHVLGAQGQLWAEFIRTPERLEYMAYPRLCALAEIVWSPRERDAYESFLARLRVHLRRLEVQGVAYCRHGL